MGHVAATPLLAQKVREKWGTRIGRAAGAARPAAKGCSPAQHITISELEVYIPQVADGWVFDVTYLKNVAYLRFAPQSLCLRYIYLKHTELDYSGVMWYIYLITLHLRLGGDLCHESQPGLR